MNAQYSASKNQFDRAGKIPALRERFLVEDDHDPERAAYNYHLWCSLDDLYRPRDRQIEENFRMLQGQQWIVWSDMKGRFVNLLETLQDDERRWRHMPVLNRLFLWFVLMHARMTENPPVLTWQPGPDRMDQLLAEVCDPIFKFVWRDVGMLEVLDRMIAIMLPAGRAHIKSRIDPFKGDPIDMSGPATLQLLNPQGSPILGANGQPIRRQMDNVPFKPGATEDDDYQPAADLVGEDEESAELKRHSDLVDQMYEGGLDVDVLTPLECRGTWGPTPWHQKPWHMQKSLITPLQAWELFGLELEPDVRGSEAEQTSILWRVLHGTGLFGSADAKRGEPDSASEFVTIYESWHRPGRQPGMERTRESAGGRLLITTGGGKVIRDGVRPAAFKYTSPIRTFDFVGLPGRPSGTSPQEYLNGPVRTRNRLHAQLLASAALMANPIRVYDKSQGIEEGKIPNRPGAEIGADRSRSKAPPIEYIQPPAIGRDVPEAADRLKLEIDQLGQVSGSEATAPTDDSSARLVRELRYNSDRPIAATMKRMVIELGRMAEDWLAIAPIIWDKEKLIALAGADGVQRTITVYPELLRDGTVHVEPEIESMMPESRLERQARVEHLYTLGVWGPPGSPSAVNQFLDQARFPHMARATRPGGADRSTAEQNVGRLLQGTPAAQIPIFPWYDHALQLYVLEQFMKSPEYLKIPPEMQAQFVAHWMGLQEAMSQALLEQQGRALDVQTKSAKDQLTAKLGLKPLADAVGPQPDEPGGAAGAGPPPPTSSTEAA